LAAKRGKSQARRNNGGGNNAIPGWAWLVLVLLLALVVFLVGRKYLGGEQNDFFRLQPNPDAQPVPVAEGEEAVAPEGVADTSADTPAKGDKTAKDADEYDFYTLLPGKEVPLSDAELAATERAEAQRLEAERKAQAAAQAAVTPAAADSALPTPVDAVDTAAPAGTTSTAASTTTPAPATVASSASAAPAGTRVEPTPAATDTTRYLLQAGAFEASGQAEELKARIAMLGLGARVESAQISGKTFYRVRMGPYGTASDLSEAKRKLAAGGLPATAIKVK
jgi:cell division protein FtsN